MFLSHRTGGNNKHRVSFHTKYKKHIKDSAIGKVEVVIKFGFKAGIDIAHYTLNSQWTLHYTQFNLKK